MNYTVNLPCASESCKGEKQKLQEVIRQLQEELEKKDTAIKKLHTNFSTIRLAVREFTCHISTNFPGTKIAKLAEKWEKDWKYPDEEGTWNKVTTKNNRSESSVRCRSQGKAISQAKQITNESNIGTNHRTVQTAEFISSEQNNAYHQFARQNVVAIKRPSYPFVQLQTAAASEESTRSSHVYHVNDSGRSATAHALVTVNQPLNLPKEMNSTSLRAETQSVLQINNSQDMKNKGVAVNNFGMNGAQLSMIRHDEPIGAKKMRYNETVKDVIVLSDDEGDFKEDVLMENVIRIPRYDSINSVRCKKSHPLVYPRINIYPGLRISRLQIKWASSAADLRDKKRIILNIQYAGDYSKQVFHILYYIRSMVEKEEAKGWTSICSKECEVFGQSQLQIQFDHAQTWLNDAIYFTGFIECGLERYGAYADVCKIDLGEQEKDVRFHLNINF